MGFWSLPFVVEIGAEIQFLALVFDGVQPTPGAVELLQLETL